MQSVCVYEGENEIEREEVWPNVYRARVARATYSARQSDAWIKSHDCAAPGRERNAHQWLCVCAFVRNIYIWVPLVPNGILIYSRFLFTHTRNTWRHTFLGDTGPIHVWPDPFSPRAWKGAGHETSPNIIYLNIIIIEHLMQLSLPLSLIPSPGWYATSIHK